MSSLRKRLVLVGSLAALFIVGLLVVTVALVPLPLPFLSNYLQALFDRNYHSHDIVFDETRLRWSLLDDAFLVQFRDVRAVDFDQEVVAEIPEVLVKVAFAPLLSGDLVLQEVSVLGARLSFYRTAGGAVKFDIGRGDEGAAGGILENLLIDIVAAEMTLADQSAFPRISLVDADVTLGDETSGAYLWVPEADIRLAPDPKGVRSTYKLEVATNGGRLRLSAESLYKTSHQRIDLAVELDRVRPAILAEILPRMGYLAPFEVPLSGSVWLELDKFFAVSSGSFELTGGPGSLEVADYSGLNLYLKGLWATGSAVTGFRNLDLTELKLDLDGAEVIMNGLLSKNDQVLSITTKLFAVDTSLAELMPRWFAQLNNALVQGADWQTGDPQTTLLSFDGRYDIRRRKLRGEGLISYGDQISTVDGPALAGAEPLGTEAPSMQFRVNGSIDAPNFVIVPNNQEMRQEPRR